MNKQKLLQELQTRQKGSLVRIKYKSSPTLAAVAKKAGYVVEKTTETTVRFGVRYSNIQTVKTRRAQDTMLGLERKEPTLWWKWEIPQILKQHLSKDERYLTVATVPKGHNTVSTYFVNGVKTSTEDLKNMGLLIPSYWNKETPATYDININNIIEIKPKRSKR